MKLTRNVLLTSLTLAALTAGAWAQTQTASNTTPPTPYPAPAAAPAPSAVTAADVQALKDALAAQQLQIQQLTQQLQRQQAIQQAQQSADTTSNAPKPAAPQQLAALGSPAAVPQQASSTGITMQEAPAPPSSDPMEGPISIHFKGITITPGGFGFYVGDTSGCAPFVTAARRRRRRPASPSRA